MTPADVAALVRDDMRALRDARVVAHVSSLQVNPPRALRVLVPRYSGEVIEGFLVLDHLSGAAIAYCPRDFAPAVPWGLISTPSGSPRPMAMSHDWYHRFLDVYFESLAVTDLDIWRVKERKPGQAPTWVSGELPWDEARKRVYALRQSAPDCQYDCDHAIMC
jgi:hypothetical protein